MAERKRNIKYFFTVEGDCEDWYLGHLQKLINTNEKSLCTVQIERVITRELEKTAKTINPVTVPQTLYHLCDVEGIDDEDQTRFQNYLKDLKMVKKQKGIQYDLGYSNFSFELWMILHKQACNGCLTYKKEYLALINKAYDENFSSLKSYKNKDNFQSCLDKIDLSDIKMAVARAKDIMVMRKRNGDKEISLYTYKYYKDNPALTIWQSIEKILKDCRLL